MRTRAGAEELRTHDAGLVVDVALDQLFDVLQRLHLKHHHRPDHLLRRICARDRLGRQQRRAVLCRVCLRVSQRVERAKQNRMRTYSAIRCRAAALRWRGAVVMCVSELYVLRLGLGRLVISDGRTHLGADVETALEGAFVGLVWGVDEELLAFRGCGRHGAGEGEVGWTTCRGC